jgi:hypothetical protein
LSRHSIQLTCQDNSIHHPCPVRVFAAAIESALTTRLIESSDSLAQMKVSFHA